MPSKKRPIRPGLERIGEIAKGAGSFVTKERRLVVVARL